MLAALLLLLGGGCDAQRIHSMAGPFRIIPGRIERCPPELDPAPVEYYYYGYRDRKNVDLWHYTANFTSLLWFDDDQYFDLNVANWGSRGGWNVNAWVAKVPRACTSFMKSVPTLWRAIQVAIHDSPDAMCPYPPATYIIRNMTTDFNIKVIPAYFYGKYRLTGRLARADNDSVVGCIRAYGELVPKVGRRRQQHTTAPPRVETNV